MSLDVQKTFSEIRDQYKADQRQNTFNALVVGTSGTGKTRLLQTCRKPVLLHSFDPGGSKTVRDAIAAGEIIADTRFENEDPEKPTAYTLWQNTFRQLTKDKVFDHVGTYAIDSLTTLSDAVIHALLRKVGHPTMQKTDWGMFLSEMLELVNKITNLPCDVILTAHSSLIQDELTGKTESGLLIAGQSKDRLPLLFDETYVMQTKEKAGGVIEYSLLTANTGFYKARTRIGAGKFSLYEPPDIKALLKKAGLPTDDKPLFK